LGAFAVAMTVWNVIAENNQLVQRKLMAQIKEYQKHLLEKEQLTPTEKQNLEALAPGKELKFIRQKLHGAALGLDITMPLSYYPYLAAMKNASSAALDFFISSKDMTKEQLQGLAQNPKYQMAAPTAPLMKKMAALAEQSKWTEARNGGQLFATGSLQVSVAFDLQFEALVAMFNPVEKAILRDVLPRVMNLDSHRRPDMALIAEMVSDIVAGGKITAEVQAKVEAVNDMEQIELSFLDLALFLGAAAAVLVVAVVIHKRRQQKN